MNGNFKIIALADDEDLRATKGKIYSFVNGVTTWDGGNESCKYENYEEFKNCNVSLAFEEFKEPLSEVITITRHKKKVVGSITDGERTYGQYIKLSKVSGDFKEAARLVVDRLLNSFEFKESEAVGKPFNWDDFKQGKFAVHCDTEEKAREFLKECDEHGIKWSGFDELTETNWSRYKDKTLYGCRDSRLSYGTAWGFDNITTIDYIPTKPTVKEVHRPAKVGEWIRITNPNKNEPYKIGDIFVVSKEIPDFDAVNVKIEGRGNVNSYGYHYIYTYEYVVLENYQPDSKPEESKKTPLSEYTRQELWDELDRRFNS